MTDQEILAQIVDSKEKVRNELRTELEALFKREKDNLLERAQLFMNVSKWTAAAMAIVFGLLGIKAWSDIRSNVEAYFQTRLEKLYRIDDAGSPVVRSIDQLLDRAVVNALYTEIQRIHAVQNSGDTMLSRRSGGAPLTTGEQERLVKMAKSSKTETREFEDVIYVLNALVATEEGRQAVSSTLAELLTASPKSEFAWISDNEKKRLAILSNFQASEAVDAVASELLSLSVSDRLKNAALIRLRKDNYKAAVPSLLKFIEATEDPALKFQGFLTLATVRPDHEKLKAFILNDLVNRTEKTDILHCLEMATALVGKPGNRFFFRDSDENEKYKRLVSLLAIPLAGKAFDSGVRLQYSAYGFQRGLMATINFSGILYPLVKVGSEVFADDFVDELLNASLKKSSLALANHLAALAVPSDRGSDAYVRIFAILRPDSVVVFEDGTSLVVSDADKSRIYLHSLGVIPKKGWGAGKSSPSDEAPKIVAAWETLGGHRFERGLKLIRNVRFEAELGISRKQLDQEPEEF